MAVADAVAPDPTVTFFPAVNTFSLAGSTLPGKWTLLSAVKKFGWQVQKGYGLSGAFIFPTGDELVVARFRGEFWASDDWLSYSTLIRKPLFNTGSFAVGGTSRISAKAMGIDHPELKALGVTAVTITEIGVGIQEEGGLWTTELEFIQFRPPVPAPPPTKTVIPDVQKPAPVAQDAQDVELQNLTKNLKALTGH